MKKFIISLSLLTMSLHAQEHSWIDGFHFKTQHVMNPSDTHVERTSAMSQWNNHRNQEEDYMDLSALKELSEMQLQKFQANQDDQSYQKSDTTLVQQSKEDQLGLLAQCQKFFMKIFAFLSKK